MNKKTFLRIIMILIITGGLFGYLALSHSRNQIAYIETFSGEKILVRVADMPREREQGLSGVERLADNEGMLFLFDKPDRYVFWMKDMNFALDIIWLKKVSQNTYQVVYLEENVLPDSYPQTFSPDEDSDAVLELNVFQAKAFHLEKGVDVTVYN